MSISLLFSVSCRTIPDELIEPLEYFVVPLHAIPVIEHPVKISIGEQESSRQGAAQTNGSHRGI
jgi:hypothetical protein